MKLSILVFVSAFISFTGFAGQYIDCVPVPHDSNDHVIVSLKDESSGTLFLTSGFDEYGDSENSGILKSKRMSDISHSNPKLAYFKAENESSQFVFSMPIEIVLRAHQGYFESHIEMSNKDGALSMDELLSCFTHL